ncbi:glycosyltransferase involved in cell wall biosynthesis [Azospirillum fermentarium]|uniref:glycosyltransferase n=1 Tax=Azospirillum fermentarium TaxID=1233114 RepID=UPI0022264447|nr:glycosyltransferase [Azospirillum fermentarium]MCW2249531.1 glycosyltransferase involved in cell wall biosynthesis [Azospirillum fermentarium]
MKILHINTFDIHGGAARAAFRLFKGLRAIGEESRMLVLHKTGNDPDVATLGSVTPDQLARAHAIQAEIQAEAAPYPMLSAPGFVSFHSERAAPGEIMVSQLPPADIIHLHWVRGLVDYPSFFANRRPDQPVVWTLHDMHPFSGGCHYAGECERFTQGCGACPFLKSDDPADLSARILERKTTALARRNNRLHIVTPSHWLGREAARSSLFRDIPVSVIPPGLETDTFVAHDRQAMRQAFKLPPGLKVILFIAHMVDDPRKGLSYLDEALCRLGPRPDVALLLVGGGTMALKSQVHHLRTGLVADDAMVGRLYSAADIVAMPSLEDNLPNTMLEAMAAGTPVIGFDIGGVPDLVIPGETGYLAPPADTEALSAALATALADPAHLAAMGRMARARIEREHTLEVMASRYRDLYRSLLS